MLSLLFPPHFQRGDHAYRKTRWIELFALMWLVWWKEAIIAIKIEARKKKKPPPHWHFTILLSLCFQAYQFLPACVLSVLLTQSVRSLCYLTFSHLPVVSFFPFFPFLTFSILQIVHHYSFPHIQNWNPEHFLPFFSLPTFLLRVVRTWKGWICFFSRSQATASESKTQETTESFFTYEGKQNETG